MSKRRQTVGRWGEAVGAAYLLANDYTLLGQNIRTPYGEIDLIARRGKVTVFVEVKTRTTQTFGYPEESITARKQEHMLAAAQHFMQEHPEFEGDWRVDVIAVEGKPGGRPRITHFENVLS